MKIEATRGRGGRRPGSGRKALPDGKKKVQITITLTQMQKEELDYLKSRAVDTNVIIGREIHRLAVAHELAEAGIV